MSTREADIVCITQTTLVIINNVLLIYNWRFMFLRLEMSFDLFTYKMPGIRIVLPFKDQKSANVVRHQPSDLSRKIDAIVQHVRGSSWTSLAGVHGPKFCALRVPASGQ